jgi:thioredoxin 1
MSKNSYRDLLKVVFILLVFGLGSATAVHIAVAEGLEQIPVQGMVTMVDLGAKKCIPCKMMAPIIEDLQREYKDRAAIVFIDVWENADYAKKFRIKLIPTQIFYDAEGNEVYRHEGFLDKTAIIAELTRLGVN